LKKVRVLHVIGGSEFGGAVWIILSYIQMLQEHGCEVIVISSNNTVADIYIKAGCRVITTIKMHREIKLVSDLIAIAKLAKVCREYRINAVHTHTSKGGFVGRAAAWIARVPIIIHTVHGFAFSEFSAPSTVYAYSALERLAAFWCDRIISVSNFHREWALRLGIAPPWKIVTIHNGISRDRLLVSKNADQVREEFCITPEEKLIGVFCRLVPQKGLELLLNAIPSVLNRKPHIKLLLVGKGPSSKELYDQACRMNINNKVVFAGFREDIGNIINACDVIISPTLWEGLSVTLIEAMAMGKAIITTDIASNKELILDQNCGIIVQANNTVALGEAIISLLSDPLLMSRYGMAAKARYEMYFTEHEMKNKLWEIYNKLINEKLKVAMP
jgi:glycosyltransferase involved in cell wall biosynthesis